MALLVSRRHVAGTLATTLAAVAAGPAAFAGQVSPAPARPPALPDDQVNQFVQVAHTDIDATRRMLDAEPRLIRATWDWGGGDFETALGGAAHMGRRDIAGFLLERGAHIDLYAAAMLGELAIVRAALEARPSLARVPGPHRIPLVAHAKAGGPQSKEVLDYIAGVLERLSPSAR
jgi:hypothetical protein